MLTLLLVSGPPTGAGGPVLFPAKDFGRVNKGFRQAMDAQREALASGVRDGAYEDVYGMEARDRFRQIGRSVGMLDLMVKLPDGRRRNTVCTATLVDQKLLLTNYHCVPGYRGQWKALKAQVRLGYLDRLEATGDKFSVSVKPVEADRTLDVSVLRVTDEIPTQRYPPLDWKTETVRDKQRLFLLHHPLGMPLQLTNFRCQAAAPALNNGRLVHRCDTLGGSSGALLFSANSASVVGIHHTGLPSKRPRNFATPVKSVVASIDVLRKRFERPPPPPPPPRDDGMVSVPAGEFFMGCNERVDSECENDEKPGRRVSVKAFRIDKTEVTVAAYRKCVQAGGCSAEGLTTAFWSGKVQTKWSKYCNWDKPDRANHPINCVNWEHARRYCAWANKRLPTDAEWEKAARGTDGRKYPWGNKGFGDVRVANIADESAKRKFSKLTVAEGYDDGFVDTAPVGSFSPAGDSPFHAQDVIGNVWEWTADWYVHGDIVRGKYRSLRGGSWLSDPRFARASNRNLHDPADRRDFVGFRCVQSE